MGKVFNWLANFPAKEKVTGKAARNMNPGDVWYYSMDLKKGIVYSIKIEGCRNVTRLACALSKGNEVGNIEVRHGRVLHLSIQPETLCVYNLSITLEEICAGAISGTVTITLMSKNSGHTRQTKG